MLVAVDGLGLYDVLGSTLDDAVDTIPNKPSLGKEEALAELIKHNPQNRLVTPEEVAGAVLWLCQDSSGSINGQSIAVAGGEIT